MKCFILIKADYNDGDYTWRKSPITVSQVKEIEPVIEAIKFRRNKLNEDLHKNWNQWRHNWETSEYRRLGNPTEMYVDTGILTQDQVDLFNEFVPYAEYGIHTIESIEIITVIGKLL